MSLDEVLEQYLWQHIEEYVDEVHGELGESA